MSTIKVRVTYFAQARELTESKEEEYELNNPTDMNQLIAEVLNAHPRLGEIKAVLRSLVNGRVVRDNIKLSDGDEITLFPPVGGG